MKWYSPKKLAAVVTIALAGAAVVALAAFFWVTTTTQGVRWLLTSASPLSGISFSAKKIEGTMSDRLLFSDVQISMAEQKIEISTLELRWKPLLLLSGTIAVQELSVNGVRIQDDAPPGNKPPDLTWPKMPGTVHLFDGMISHLRVSDISYRRQHEKPVQVTSIDSSLTWQENILTISELKAESTSGQISGTISAGFKQPSISAELALALTIPVAEMNQFSVQIRPGSSSSKEQLSGKVTIVGSADKRKLLELIGDVGMARNAFNLQRLRLSRPEQSGLITGEGSLTFTPLESLLSLQLKASDLDLAPELNMPTDLSGTLKFSGTMKSYRGNFNFANKGEGWQKASFSSAFQGTSEGMKLAPLTGKILDGSLSGNLDIDWRKGFALRGTLNGRNLNPAMIDPKWNGVANFNAAGQLASIANAPLAGSVTASLLQSRLHGQELTGELKAKFADNNLTLSRLVLQGKGFDLHASGDLSRRLTVGARITDLSKLVPGSAGKLQSDGWVRWRDQQLSGSVTGSGSHFSYSGTEIATVTLTARLDQGKGYPGHVSVSMKDVINGEYKLDAVTVEVDGTLLRHTLNTTLLSGGSEARLTISAGYNDSFWKGKITNLTGKDSNGIWNLAAPAAFALSSRRFSLSPLTLTTATAERFKVDADLGLKPLSGQLRAEWADLNLARVNPFLKDMQISGSSQGAARLGFLSGKRINLSGNAAVSGTITEKSGSITIERSLISFDGGEKGIRIGIDLNESTGGRLKGTFTSDAPLLVAMPGKGKLTAEWSGLDVALLKPWLPDDYRVEGRINGRASGILLPGQRFELDGTAALSGGGFHQGELNLAFASATASWMWRDEELAGALALNMAEQGQARANFQLPVPARFPVAVKPKSLLRAALNGRFQEQGFISALFPGLVQKSFGDLDAKLEISGTWEEPQLGGTFRLSGAGAYLPTAGLHLKDVQLTAHLEKNLIRIDSFRAISGPGHIEASALVTLAGWQVTGYKGTIEGDNFQTFYSPELRILSTPKLSFEGTPQILKLRGELRLPELQLDGAPSRSVIMPSGDVVLEGLIVPTAKSTLLALDVEIRVLLGEKVFVKVAGIDAQLGGAMDLSLNSIDRITGRGEIKVVKGRYRTYGVDLSIVRGRLFFAGGPIDSPALDFLALRTVGDVQAGVTVAGSIRNPVVKLYSEPAMPDVDIMAYIILGRPYESSGEQASLMTKAAGALLTSSQATAVQDQLKNQFGFSTLEIQGGVGAGAGAMGYKPLQVTAPGAIPATVNSGITETVLTVGKYLTPQLYVSYGKSLFTGNNLFLLRYDIFKHWQIETQTGNESGADLFYKLEFK